MMGMVSVEAIFLFLIFHLFDCDADFSGLYRLLGWLALWFTVGAENRSAFKETRGKNGELVLWSVLLHG